MTEPPIMVSKIKNKDKWPYDVLFEIPDVEIDEVIERKTSEKFSLGNKKK